MNISTSAEGVPGGLPHRVQGNMRDWRVRPISPSIPSLRSMVHPLGCAYALLGIVLGGIARHLVLGVLLSAFLLMSWETQHRAVRY